MCAQERESPCKEMHLSPNKMQREFANASFLLLSLFRFFCSFLSQHNRSIFTSRQSCTAKTLPHSCHLFSKLSLSKFTIFSLLFLSSLPSTYLVHLILHSIFSLVHGPEIIVVSFYIFFFFVHFLQLLFFSTILSYAPFTSHKIA